MLVCSKSKNSRKNNFNKVGDVDQKICDEITSSCLSILSQNKLCEKSFKILSSGQSKIWQAKQVDGKIFSIFELAIPTDQYNDLEKDFVHPDQNPKYIKDLFNGFNMISDQFLPDNIWYIIIDLVESNINEDHRYTINNSGYNKTIQFNSRTEKIIFEELVKCENLMIIPLPLTILGIPENYKTPDFLLCQNGKWGILEIHGSNYHPPERAAKDFARRREFLKFGLKCMEFYDAGECQQDPAGVINNFLNILNNT